MMSLGSRAVQPETLEQRIARRLNEALDRQIAGEFETLDQDRGLCEWYGDGHAYRVLLSVEDVSRIAAQEARSWF